MFELVLAYAAGLLTLINPCVLPVLPIVLATALQAGRWGPAALAGGMAAAFVTLGFGVAVAGRSLGLTEDTVIRAAAVLMVLFGLTMLVPAFGTGFATATAGMAGRADAGLDRVDRTSLWGQAAGGALLGAVWSPCIGPTLGSAIALASQGADLGRAFAIMAAFAAGVATLVLALGYGARGLLARHRAAAQALAQRARPILGAVFVAVGTGIFFQLHHAIEAWALDTLPPWLIDLSVSI
jgi:cytochrome c-type biogenesis protein